MMSWLVMFSVVTVLQLPTLSLTYLRGRDNDDKVVAEHRRHESIPRNAGEHVRHLQVLQRVDQQSQTHEAVMRFFSQNATICNALYENDKHMDRVNTRTKGS